jgi:DNA-binding GntR family transcriptional regulator
VEVLSAPSNKVPVAGATLTETAYARLREDILRGRLAPGEKLRIEWLRDSYEIGASPLREALSRLATSSLVVAKGQQGFYVAQVSIPQLLDITKARVWAQTLAIRAAIAQGDRDWEAHVLAATHRLGRIEGNGDPDTWEAQHTDFHDTLISACGSQHLINHCAQLQDLSDRYRWVSIRKAVSRDPHAEHIALKDAVLARDKKAAERLIHDHLVETTRIIIANDPSTEDKAEALIGRLKADIRSALV